MYAFSVFFTEFEISEGTCDLRLSNYDLRIATCDLLLVSYDLRVATCDLLVTTFIFVPTQQNLGKVICVLRGNAIYDIFSTSK